MNQSILSALSPTNKKGRIMESLGTDMEQDDVQVNFDDVQFFNNQSDIRNGGKSQVSSFVSKDIGRMSGPDNEMGDFMQNGNSFHQNNGSF
jgi:hypothetical protein